MAYDIRLAKLVNGETVLGKWDEAENAIKEPAVLQTVPTEQGVQMMLLPYGYPFDQDFGGTISLDHVIFQYKTCPDELEKKYLESTTNLTLSTPGDLRNLQMPGRGGKGVSDISQLLKK